MVSFRTMAWFLFVDESGQDLRNSPYEVLAGVAVRDQDFWPLIQEIHAAELDHFGRRYSDGQRELKAQKILKRKTFRHAAQTAPLPSKTRLELAKHCLEHGAGAGRLHLTALAQAKLAYVHAVLDICRRFNCRAFASIVTRDATRTDGEDFLRKDYAYLFQRFFYFLEEVAPAEMGIVVFDELEKAKSHLLLDQMTRYFRDTRTGRDRSSRIIPEPFFVHSDMTTGVQLADLAAYIISWGFRDISEEWTSLGGKS